jgi:nucleotide-binding universal stress UspA family protein
MMNRLQLGHVLCPTDLSPLSANALEWASTVARARAADLRALHVIVVDGVVPPEDLGFGERDEMMRQLREALAGIDSGNRLTGAAVRQGDPGHQILQYAKSIAADLIVMGAAGAERPSRPMGSVAATVVPRSDCPALIVPAGRRVDPSVGGVFEHIVCAVDTSPSSVGVMRQALSLGWETHAHVMFVCVMTEQFPSSRHIEEQLLAAIPPEASAWCDVEVVVKRGVPATEIVRVAETSDVDLLVIGPPRQWTSTTQGVLARSLCPVLVTHDARPLPYPGGRSDQS